MGWEGILTVVTLLSVLSTLMFTRYQADLVLVAAMAFLLVIGVLTPAHAFAGFANPGVITIATLYVVAAGLKETGAVQWIARHLLGHPKTARGAQLRMVAPTGILSAFMNNTAVVAMFIPAVQAGFLAAGAMIASGCITASRARGSIDLPVLIVIAASFALGNAMIVTGASAWIAESLFGGGVLSPWLALLIVYALTATFTEVITNNAAAVLMFPIAAAVAEQLGVSVLPFAIAVMFAASASFITPLGYQTNLMVYGPGRYRFADYAKLGIPLSLIAGAVSVILIPLVWPF